jgi:GR25 family glycosyltransferase involved in LPS biosynthesis
MLKYKIFCINLIEREDRYNFMQNEFKKIHDLLPENTIEFVRNNRHLKGGRYGCFESHIQCVKKALSQNLDYCVILEDDCTIKSNFISSLLECEAFISKSIRNKSNSNSNINIDIIYSHNYGCVYLDRKITNNIYKGKFLGAACIVVARKFMTRIIKKYKAYINTWHYDLFLLQISKNSFTNLNYMIQLANFSSDNDEWSKNNKLINYAQKIGKFTTMHTFIHNCIVIFICKLLIKTKNTYLLNKFICISTNFYVKNLL